MAGTPTASRPIVVGVGADGTIVGIDGDVEQLLGWTTGALIGRPLEILIPQRFRRRHREGFQRFVETGSLGLVGRPLELPALHIEGREVPIELILSMASPDHPARVVGVLRRRAGNAIPHFKLTAELREVVASDAPFGEVLERCLALIGPHVGAELGTAWIRDRWIDDLRPVVTWVADPGRGGAYVDARSTADVPPHIAKTSERGTLTWIDDIAALEPTAVMWLSGAAAATCIPLVADTEPVGVLELVHPHGQEVGIETQEAISFLGAELGRLVATRIREEMEQAERERLQLALDARGLATWSYRYPSGEMIADRRLAELFGLPEGVEYRTVQEYGQMLVDEEHRAATRSRVFEAIERRERFDFQYQVRRYDGSIAWLAGSGVPIVDDDGSIRELTGVFYDVTEQVRAQQEMEEQARYAALAADVGRAFVREAPLDVKLGVTVESIVWRLDAAFARIWTLDEGSDTLELRASAGRYTHLDGDHSQVRMGEYKIGRIAAERRPHMTNDVPNDPRVSDPDWAREEGMQAFAGYPLLVGDRCVGVLALFATHQLPDSTLDILASVADTVAIGISQSKAAEEVMALYGETHRAEATLEAALRDRARVAEVLQSSLVPPVLPAVPGLAVAARYRSGIEEVGGDFYDLLALGDGRWAFLIGDICGRGPEAARLTALARHSLRMAVMLGRRPARALGALNRALLNSDNDGRFCTAVCGVIGQLDGESSRIDLGVAGHPAPLVLRSNGKVEEVEARGTLLGVLHDTQFSQVDVRLAIGDTLIVYTDGVIEARRGADFFGAQRLRAVVDGLGGESPDRIADEIVRAVSDFDEQASRDDLAVLVFTRVPVEPGTGLEEDDPTGEIADPPS